MRIKMKNNLLTKSIQSFFATWALMMASRMQVGNILTLVFFLLCFFFFRHIDVRLSKSDFEHTKYTSAVCLVLAAIFSALYMAVDYTYYVENLTNPLFRISILTAVLIGFLVLFYNLVLLLFSFTGDKNRMNALLFSDGEPTTPLFSFYQKHPALCAFLLCILCWLPYFLYQYPGIMTPDSINQLEQVLHVIPYSNHHPFMHTLLIGLFYNMGYRLTGNMVVAMSFYTFFQMCMLALAVSYLIGTLRQFRLRSLGCFIITLLYALIPYHAVFSVTVWKDILFAAGVLFFGCSMLRLLKEITIPSLIVMGISGLVMCLFRSNGWYAYLLCLPFLLLYFRRKAKTVFPVLIGAFAVAVIVKYPVMNSLSVTQPDLIESLSVPTQQITAVICNDRPLTQEQLTLIENVVDLTYIKELYNPYYADNIKELVRAGHQDYLVAHKREFLKLWIQLGLAYPGDYLEAYIYQTYGYWYPDSFYLVAEAEGVSATSLGVSHTPLIGGPLVVKGKEIAIKLGGMLPLYGTLWSMGVALWILIFCIGNSFIRREKRKLILYLPTVALFLTVMLATPVATEFRYVYFLVFGLPFYLITSVLRLPE
ncbi:MAG: DUF6020 family protein [Bacillota bacterium]|nr:DUF6020 family protein [Bacillota bacterium]